MLSSCSTTAQLRQAAGCVSPDCLASRAERLSLCQLITSDQVVTHGARASAPLCRGVSGRPRQCNSMLQSQQGFALQLISSRLASHLERRVLILRILNTSPGSSEPFTLASHSAFFGWITAPRHLWRGWHVPHPWERPSIRTLGRSEPRCGTKRALNWQAQHTHPDPPRTPSADKPWI